MSGNLKLITGLVWTLILHYSIAVPMNLIGGPGKKPTAKQVIVSWIKRNVSDLHISNLTTDWNDGRAIGALVDAVQPGESSSSCYHHPFHQNHHSFNHHHHHIHTTLLLLLLFLSIFTIILIILILLFINITIFIITIISMIVATSLPLIILIRPTFLIFITIVITANDFVTTNHKQGYSQYSGFCLGNK